MTIKIRRAKRKELKIISDLDHSCMPEDYAINVYDPQSVWWVATHNNEIVGYAGCKPHKPDNAIFLHRAGVRPGWRGHGIQKKLIRTRINYAKRHNAGIVYTYTTLENIPSSNNLISQGFSLFWPSSWHGEKVNLETCGCLYWILYI